MPGISPSIDYTARTFERNFERAMEVFKRRLGVYRFNDVVATGLAPGVLSVQAWFHEQNSYYYARRFRSSFLELADTPEAMAAITRGMGYRMRPATSASVSVRATPTPPQPVPIILTKGTRVSVGDLTFEVGVDAIIPGSKSFWPDGTTNDLIVLAEGATRVENYTSSGAQFQKIPLGQPNTIEGSISVKVMGEEWDEVAALALVEGDRRGRDTFTGDGTDSQQYDLSDLHAIIDQNDEDAVVIYVTPVGGSSADAQRWQQVDAFTGAAREFTLSQTVDGVTTVTFGLLAHGSAPQLGDIVDIYYLIAGAQKRYQVTFDDDNRATLLFGDGVFGVVPPAGATIEVTYRTGGGVRGNVLAGTINTVVQGVLPSGARTPVAIRNLEAGRGGEPPETIEHARFFAPRRVKANERAVMREDFTALAATYFDKLYGAPSHASAFLKQSTPELNTVVIAVWGRDTFGQVATANSPLKAGIKNALDAKRTICTTVEMKDGEVVLMDIAVDITVLSGKVAAAVFADVTAAIQRFFNSSRVLPGINLSISQLYDAIQQVSGVSRAEITKVVGCVRTTATVTPGTGDGTTNLFTGRVTLPEGTQVVAKSLVISDGTQQVVDDGGGGFTGDILPGVIVGAAGNANSLVDGSFSVSFASAPVLGRTLTCEAKVEVFFDHEENLGASDGNFARADGATDYYPIVKRAPRGLWSGDQHKILDAFRIGTTSQIRGRLPRGIVPSSFSVTYAGTPQTVVDNGSGTIVTSPGNVPVGTITYATGDIDFTFATPLPGTLATPIKATWTTKTMDIFLPSDLIPLRAGRVYIWGGYGADGAQTPAEIVAYDDGEGNIAGNVLVGGTISYEDGHIVAEWNANPPPGPAAGGTATGTLTQVPDGIRKTFDFTTGGANFGTGGLGGVGRTRLQLSDLSSVGFTVEDAYDNWQGAIHGASLDRLEANTFNYTAGTGKITFLTAPPVGSPTTFALRVTNVATVLYAGWVFRVKTPSAPGLDKGLFADNNGRFWGPPAAGTSDAFPTAKLDHLRGRYAANLAGSPVAAGRSLLLTYDAKTGVPPALDIVVEGDQLAAVGTVSITEKQGEAFNG